MGGGWHLTVRDLIMDILIMVGQKDSMKEYLTKGLVNFHHGRDKMINWSRYLLKVVSILIKLKVQVALTLHGFTLHVRHFTRSL